MINKITIYAPFITPRLQYSCDLIFANLLGAPFSLVESEEIFEESTGVKVNYSAKEFSFDTLNILPAGLLFETGIHPLDIQSRECDGNKIQFPVDKPGYYPFDIFSAVFFMTSRYEEYLPFAPDQFGRFTEAQSISGKYGFTQKPVVNIWCKALAENLSLIFNGWQSPPKKASVLFTYDIDVAYAFKGRPLKLHLLSLAKDLVNFNLTNIKAKIETRFGKRDDPSDTYNFISQNPIEKLFFFLLTQQRGKYDNNISPSSAALQKLIVHIKNHFGVGIHPSYHAIDQKQLFENELGILEKIVGGKITASRQHFLRLRFPDTYRQLIAAGILHDYTLAYAEKPGFRAGICSPYLFFDLEKNEVTNLTIHPTCIMDSCFRDDLHLTAAESLTVYIQVLAEVLSVGGEFVSIWHNDLLAERKDENHPLNFRKTYLELTEEVMKQNL